MGLQTRIKMGFFTVSISAPASIPSVWPPPLVTHLVLPQFFPCQLNSSPWMHHPLPPSVLPRPGFTAATLPPVPCQPGGLWVGSKSWEYPTGGRGSVHGNVAAGPLSVHAQDAPLELPGCSFLKAGYPLQQGRSQRLGVRLLVPFCTLASTAGSSKLQALDKQYILLTRSNSITWNND